jgi:hypothetical protein
MNKKYTGLYEYLWGRDIYQVVIRRLPTAAARVRSKARSCLTPGGQSGTWACSLQVLPFFSFGATQPTFGPWPTSMKLSVLLQFIRSWTFGRTPWTGDQLVARPLPIHKHRKTHIHKH